MYKKYNYDIITFSKVKMAIKIKYIEEIIIAKLYILKKII